MKKLILSFCLALAAISLSACQTTNSEKAADVPTASVLSTTPIHLVTSSPIIQYTDIPTVRITIATAPMATLPAETLKADENTGYITKAYTSDAKNYITIDYVDIYSGDEAIKKAREDGSDIVEKDEDGKYFIPNDYYIRNVNSQLRTFQMASVYKIQLLNEGADLQGASFTELISAVKERKRLVSIKLNSNVVESIIEIYVP